MLMSILRGFHCFVSTETLSLITFLLSLLELDIGISPAYLVFCDSKVHNTDVTEQSEFVSVHALVMMIVFLI